MASIPPVMLESFFMPSDYRAVLFYLVFSFVTGFLPQDGNHGRMDRLINKASVGLP
jgi:hypothetical protein